MPVKHWVNFFLLSVCITWLMPMDAFAQNETPQSNVQKNVPENVPKNVSHFIDLEWEAIPGATKYELELTHIEKDGDRQKPIQHTSSKTSWRPKVIPGNYELRIRAFDERGAPGEWSEASALQITLPTPVVSSPKSGSQIQSKSQNEQEVKFQWGSIAGVESYEIEIKSDDGKFNDRWKTNETSKSITLPVGNTYMYRMRSLSENDDSSPISEEWQTVTIAGPKLPTPQPLKPLSPVIDSVQWKESAKADSYSYDILRRVKGKKWTYVQKNQEAKGVTAPFAMANPSGTYMLRVRAKGKHRQPSNQAKMVFKVRGGFRSPAAFKEAVLQESMQKPTRFYGIGSYYFTKASYTGLNKERSGQTASFDALTGTGRFGLGYQHPARSWGIFGIADFGGILVDGQNNTFASVEAHGTYKTFLWGANQFIFSGGPYMTQLPEIVGNELEGLKSFDKITNIGLHGGFKYWRPITEKYGLQLNARVYMPVAGSSPTGKAIKSLISYQYGLLGSYRWSKNIVALAGYAFRLSQAGYEAQTFEEIGDGFAEDGDVNSISMSGHYLNLILEYSF